MLGNSQTFLGVLTTIIVLCVFLASSSNLLFNILKPIKNDIKANIKEIDRQFEGDKDKLKDKTKEVKEKVGKIFTFCREHNVNHELSNKALKLLDEIEFNTQSIENYVTKSKKWVWKRAFKVIMNAKEIILAPLYTLLFCMVVFVFNEIWGLNWIDCKLLGTSLYSFLFISTAFWILVWIYFWNRTRIKAILPSPNRTGNVTERIMFPQKQVLLKISTSTVMFFLPIFIVSDFNILNELSIFLSFVATCLLLLIILNYYCPVNII